MYKQLYVLKTGSLVRIEKGWKRAEYIPTRSSLKRIIRLLLKYRDTRSRRVPFRVSSTTGRWDHFDSSFSYNLILPVEDPDPSYNPE